MEAARPQTSPERLRRLEGAFPHGDFPPITVQRLGDAHFVVDGHHRVAAARRRRMETIDWYARVYLPTIEAMTETPLAGACREATDADRFLRVHGLRPRLLVEHGTRELPDVVRRPPQPRRRPQTCLRWRRVPARLRCRQRWRASASAARREAP